LVLNTRQIWVMFYTETIALPVPETRPRCKIVAYCPEKVVGRGPSCLPWFLMVIETGSSFRPRF